MLLHAFITLSCLVFSLLFSNSADLNGCTNGNLTVFLHYLQILTANAYENNIAVVVTCFHISFISGGLAQIGGIKLKIFLGSLSLAMTPPPPQNFNFYPDSL